jgi:asparagine synthase (glutamine-hydrolysing)
MCGFVAAVSPQELDRALLDEMRDRLAHRGPDGAQSWTGRFSGGFVALGHRRLSIIDLTHAADQPMLSRDGRKVLVYNGEIYNYIELREELVRAGHTFRSTGDTEVLLVAYEQWGVECLPRLNGMFAFALWDADREELFVARDRFGEKPLFTARLPHGGIAFASEMKALLAHPDLPARPHPAAVEAYAAGRYYEDSEQTLFDGIVRVMPAHAALIADGRIRRQWRYWTPDYTAVHDDYREEDAVERFAELLRRSVSMRLRSDVPVGTSLSGGLDSSMIVCLLSALRGASPTLAQKTFSGRFDTVDPTLSEGPQIDAVVRSARVSAHAVTPEPHRLVEESERLHWHQEEPFLSASIYLQWCVMRLAAEHRTTVLLDGQGADELLAGYQFYFPSHQLDLLDRGRLVRLVRETTAFRRRLRRASRAYPDSRRRFDAEIALGWKSLAVALRRRYSVYHGDYTVGVPPARPGSRLRRIVAEALQYNSLPTLLRYADRNAMAFSRETRFPFLDYDLVDWCIRLPDQALVEDGWQKYILRRAGEGILPPEIQWRADKVGYVAPLDVWLRDGLYDWARERLLAGPILDVPGYERNEIARLWREHQSGDANHSWALWRWISLNEWFALLDNGRWRSGLGEPRAAVAKEGVRT